MAFRTSAATVLLCYCIYLQESNRKLGYLHLLKVTILCFIRICLFIKIFRAASPAVVIECQRNFRFLLLYYKYRSGRQGFCKFFSATENSLCLLFYDNATKQLYDILCEYDTIRTANQLANRIYTVSQKTTLMLHTIDSTHIN